MRRGSRSSPEEAVCLEQVAGRPVAKRRLEADQVETLLAQMCDYVFDQGLAVVELDCRELSFAASRRQQRRRSATKDVELRSLNVDLEVDGGRVREIDAVKPSELDFLGADHGRLGGVQKVARRHRQKGAALSIRRDMEGAASVRPGQRDASHVP